MPVIKVRQPVAEKVETPKTVIKVRPVTSPQETTKVIKPKKGKATLVKNYTITLPDEPEEPITDINEVTFLIYGENKIGKTSLGSMFPDPLFLMFEPGGKGLRIKRRQVDGWKQFVEYVDAICESDKYDNIFIDPISLCYKACVDYICEKEGVTDPMDVGWGNGWKAIEDEFVKQIGRLATTHRGVIFLGHPDQGEFEKRTGGKFNKIQPRMMKQARNFVEAFVDVIAFYGYYGDERFMTIEGSDELDAGNRLKYQFRTVSGEKVHSIPMGDSEEEAYANLLAAFNNEQEDPCEPDYNASVGDTPAKRSRKSK